MPMVYTPLAWHGVWSSTVTRCNHSSKQISRTVDRTHNILSGHKSRSSSYRAPLLSYYSTSPTRSYIYYHAQIMRFSSLLAAVVALTTSMSVSACVNIHGLCERSTDCCSGLLCTAEVSMSSLPCSAIQPHNSPFSGCNVDRVPVIDTAIMTNELAARVTRCDSEPYFCFFALVL